MKTLLRAALILSALLFASMSVQAAQPPGYWQYPAIKGYGPVHPRPNAAQQPDKNTIYKVVFNVTKGATDKGQPNPGLNHLARAVNVFASAGVPLTHLRFVAVIHGPATASVLDAKAYKAKFHTANPNLKLIKELRKAGVEIEVCGQALSEMHIEDGQVNSDVTITLSALADLAIYGQRGYAYEHL